MKGYKITQEQRNEISKTPFSEGQYFNPVQDINGEWFIFETEMNYAVKNKGWVRTTITEYIPPIDKDMI